MLGSGVNRPIFKGFWMWKTSPFGNISWALKFLNAPSVDPPNMIIKLTWTNIGLILPIKPLYP